MTTTRQIALTIIALVVAALLILHHYLHRLVGPPGPGIVDRSVTQPLNQPSALAAPLEAYEVYSALYHAPIDEPLVFAAESSTDIPQLNGNCLRPHTPEEREMADAFETANRHSHNWDRKFTIPQPYRLLTHDEVSQSLVCMDSHGEGSPSCEQFRHVRYLGNPGFDRTHTRALVSVVKKCGRYCGSGGIFEVRKTGNAWQRANLTDFTSECSWMY